MSLLDLLAIGREQIESRKLKPARDITFKEHPLQNAIILQITSNDLAQYLQRTKHHS